MQEFVTGMALCLHGGIKEKCHLLFKIFNLVWCIADLKLLEIWRIDIQI